jgi:hypothetical protein
LQLSLPGRSNSLDQSNDASSSSSSTSADRTEHCSKVPAQDVGPVQERLFADQTLKKEMFDLKERTEASKKLKERNVSKGAIFVVEETFFCVTLF